MNEKPQSIILPIIATISLVAIAGSLAWVWDGHWRSVQTEIFILLGLVLYFLPTLNAIDREHAQVPALFVLNLLLGATVIGWVVALVWSFVKKGDR